VAQVSLGVLMLGLGSYSFAQKELGQSYAPLHRDFRGFVFGGIVLFVVGMLNGSLASGTGLFVTIWLIRWFGLDY
jgi:hypothetical protein